MPPGARSRMVSQKSTVSSRSVSRQSRLRLLQLIGGAKDIPGDIRAAGGKTTYADLVSRDGLAEIAKYAWAVGPSKANVLPIGADGRLQTVAPWLADGPLTGLRVEALHGRMTPERLEPIAMAHPH